MGRGSRCLLTREMDVAAHVTRRHAHGSRHGDEEMREVLAHAGAQRQDIVDRAVDVGHRAVVREIAADGERQLFQRLLDRRGRRWIGDGVTARELSNAVDLSYRRAKAKEVVHQLLARVRIQRDAGFHCGAADDAQSRVRADQVEIVHMVAEAVLVGACFQTVAQLELEIEASLAVAVHRPQPDLHHRLRDRA